MSREIERSTNMRRLPLSYLAAEYVEGLPGVAGTAVVAAFASQRPDGLLGEWAWPLFGAVLLLRVVPPISTWISLRIGLACNGVWVSTGLVNRRLQFTAWDAIRTVQVDEPWNYRAFGVARVALLQGGDSARSVLLPGIKSTDASEVARRAEQSTPPAVADDPTLAAAEASPVVIYRSSFRDLLIASLMYGKFATTGTVIAVTVAEGLDTWGLLGALPQPTPVQAIVGGVAIAGVVMAAGSVATVLRFAGLEATMRGGAIVLRYGVVSTRERVVSAESVVGVDIRRNLLEIGLRRVRLSLITVDSSSRLGFNLVLPSLREEVARQLLGRSPVPRALRDAAMSKANRVTFTRAAATFVGTVVVAAAIALIAVLVFQARSVYGVAIFVAANLGLHLIGNAVSAQLHVSSDLATASVSTRYVSVHERNIDCQHIHLMSGTSLGSRLVHIRLHYYAGRPRVAFATRFDAAHVRALARSLGKFRPSQIGSSDKSSVAPQGT